MNYWLKSIPRVYLELLVKYYADNLARTPIETHKCDEKWPLFVNKQLFWWSASIILDNYNDVQTFSHVSHLGIYHIPQLA